MYYKSKRTLVYFNPLTDSCIFILEFGADDPILKPINLAAAKHLLKWQKLNL